MRSGPGKATSPARRRFWIAMLAAALAAAMLLVVAAGASGPTEPYTTYEATITADSPATQYRFDDAMGASTLADSRLVHPGSDTPLSQVEWNQTEVVTNVIRRNDGSTDIQVAMHGNKKHSIKMFSVQAISQTYGALGQKWAFAFVRPKWQAANIPAGL